ncbi:hypothetical protein GCM10010885_03840 [Alicyclobacillus cellulosilyticus]|uniref:DUF2254 domain-containing protein n=1 Tax=Alicyclobacillus cellulosilyticus TaxID=1003997 RepID=A0A917K3D3_9BACL|nr:DUF2254 family protein [Alicyclobacillus cellulosilyticus]GGI97424.1 hypothetical protein GCM10010885_03840 [Alicyclobacillus cellulosilyticus]
MTLRWDGFRHRAAAVTSSWLFHLLFSAVVMLVVFLRPPSVFFGDTETARNYLNTIVSSLSTILALCISIILVAIQLTASNYTHRVLDFFVRLPYNASLFSFYLVTIMHSFFLMAKIRDPYPDPMPSPLRLKMSADLVLVVICFISLLIYMYAVVKLLKPERIIELILREYASAFARGEWESALASIDQICDIGKRAAAASDSVTGVRCVEAMLQLASRLPLPDRRSDPLLHVHQHLVNQWVEMVGVAVKERESGVLYAVLGALYAEGHQCIAAGAWPAAELVIKAYRHLVFSHLLAEGQGFYVERVAEQLYRLAAQAAQAGERGQSFCVRTWEVILSIGENTLRALSGFTPSLLDGFLMVADVPHSLARMQDDLVREALCGYFELWKAFMATASMRDAARWAVWWADAVAEDAVRRTGQAYAVMLARHLGRSDLAETVCHIWGMDPCLRTTGPAPLAPDDRIRLFDGWPADGPPPPRPAERPHA